MTRPVKATIEDLLRRTVKDEKTGCFLIPGRSSRPKVWDPTRGRAILASRAIVERSDGPIPDHIPILHRRECPNRGCINRAHLYVGTPSENAKDSHASPLEKNVSSDGSIIIWTRIASKDIAELKRRKESTGASVAAQIRILVHDALRAQKGKIR